MINGFAPSVSVNSCVIIQTPKNYFRLIEGFIQFKEKSIQRGKLLLKPVSRLIPTQWVVASYYQVCLHLEVK